jgi:hypothetical protein
VASIDRDWVSLSPLGRGRRRIRSTSRLAGLIVLIVHLGCQPAPASPPQQTVAPASVPGAETRQAPSGRDNAPAAADRYDLQRDETRGGHTLARHVGRSDADLRARLRREQISAASTYTDRAIAERVVARTLARQRSRVDRWLARRGPRPNLALDYHGQPREIIGRSLTRRSPQPLPCTDAVVVLRWDGGRGFIVLTSYPEISR